MSHHRIVYRVLTSSSGCGRDQAVNIAPLQGERHGSAVPMVFMP